MNIVIDSHIKVNYWKKVFQKSTVTVHLWDSALAEGMITLPFSSVQYHLFPWALWHFPDLPWWANSVHKASRKLTRGKKTQPNQTKNPNLFLCSGDPNQLTQNSEQLKNDQTERGKNSVIQQQAAGSSLTSLSISNVWIVSNFPGTRKITP